MFFFIINYSFLDKALENFLIDSETVRVERIIDGDTIIINQTSVRLLGINSPERGETYYPEAKEFLEELILNKTVKLEFGREKYDKYKRILAYVFISNENINLKLVEEGFANFYFPSGKDFYYNDFESSWKKCVENNKNLCEKSKNVCLECIELKNFDVKNQEIIFHNSCNFNCDLSKWEIKDEGRKSFIFPDFVLESKNGVKIIVEEGNNNEENLFWKNEEYVWTKSGDTLFLRDDKGRLVLWENY